MATRIVVSGIAGPSIFHQTNYKDFSSERRSTEPVVSTYKDIVTATKVNGNTGNLVIGEGAVAALNKAEVTYLPFWFINSVVKNPERLENFRKSFDMYVHVTANMIRADYSAELEADVLEKMDIPTLILGMGIQRREDLDSLPVGTQRFLEILSTRHYPVFTRGKETAEFLRSKGLTHVTMTGCPSLYFRPDAMTKSLSALPHMSPLKLESCMLGGHMGRDATAISDSDFLRSLGSDVHYVMQDEYLFYNLAIEAPPEEPIYDKVSGSVTATYVARGLDETDYRPTLHVFFETETWRKWAATHDLYFGRRFHGGIVSMQVGIPTIFIPIDDRMREMLSYIGFPTVDAKEFSLSDNKEEYLRRWLDDLDIAACIDRYRTKEGEFRAALATLGIE
jgi:hypothetical protein